MSAPLHRWFARIVLLVLPAVLAATGIWLAQARGPLWLAANSDPSYQYLFNSLLVFNGQPPCHVDHPGTTVQTLGAMALSATTPGKNRDEQTLAVLSDPERTLTNLHHFFLAVSAVALALAGLMVLEHTGSSAAAWAIQLTPLLQTGTYRSTLFVAPEALLTPITVLLVALLVVRESVVGSPVENRRQVLLDVSLGLLAAAGLVTKVTFAPLCLLPLLMARSLRSAFWTTGAMVVGAALYLAPIVSQLPRMFRWFTQLATHQGTYGSGAAGFIDAAAYPADLVQLAISDYVLAGAVIGGLAVAIWSYAARPAGESVRRPVKLLFVVTAVQAIGLLLVAKHARPHYLLPVALSCALNVVISLQVVAMVPQGTRRRALPAVWGIALGVASALAAVNLSGLSHQLRDARDAQLQQARHADELTRNGLRIDYYRSSSLPFALDFGNGSAWRLYAGALNKLYPGCVFFNVWTGRFQTFAGSMLLPDVFSGKKIFLVGNGSIEALPPGTSVPLPPGWRMTLIDRRGETTVHLLQRSD